MNINTLLDDVCKGIAGNTAIETYVQAQFGKSFKVFQGYDEDNPPAEANHPCVCVGRTVKLVGRAVKTKRDGLYVVPIIYNSTGYTQDVTYTKLYRLPGVIQSEAFRKVVETAIGAVSTGNAHMREVSITYDDRHPHYYKSVMEITWAQLWTAMSDPLL